MYWGFRGYVANYWSGLQTAVVLLLPVLPWKRGPRSKETLVRFQVKGGVSVAPV